MGEEDIYFLIRIQGFLILLERGDFLRPIRLVEAAVGLIDGVCAAECEEIERGTEVVDGASREMENIFGELAHRGLRILGGVIWGGNERIGVQEGEILVVAVDEKQIWSGVGGGGVGVRIKGLLDCAEIGGGGGWVVVPDAEISELEENVGLSNCGVGVRDDTAGLTGVSVPVSDECDDGGCGLVCVHRTSISYLWKRGEKGKGRIFQKILESSRGAGDDLAKF